MHHKPIQKMFLFLESDKLCNRYSIDFHQLKKPYLEIEKQVDSYRTEVTVHIYRLRNLSVDRKFENW
jgi:hypothetical protein